MRPRRRFVIVAATALAAAGGGAAIAATDEEDKGKKTEDAILSDAAERLDVEPTELRSALTEAELAQIDKAVEDGVITEDDADHIKKRLQESGRVLGFPGGPPPGGPHGLHGPGGPGGPAVFDAIADELGISVERLHTQLMRGKRLAQIARANGKSLIDVKAAARDALEEEIDQGVEDGRLSDEEAERLRDDIPDMLDRLVRGPGVFPAPPRRRGGDFAVPLPPMSP
jgi:ribosomal protein S20